MDKTTIGSGERLTHAQWGAPPFHVPNYGDGSYKTELALLRSEAPVPVERLESLLRALTGLADPSGLYPDNGDGVVVVKLVWWHEPDPRRDPHSHPWPFKSLILSGGYTESIAFVDDNGYITEPVSRTHRAGDINIVPRNAYHTVDAVEPGTTTLMVCGATPDITGWGYWLGGKHVPVQDAGVDGTFFQRMCVINPHKRPKK